MTHSGGKAQKAFTPRGGGCQLKSSRAAPPGRAYWIFESVMMTSGESPAVRL